MLQQSSFWDVRDDNKGSWIWRKLLKLRQLAYPFIRIEVMNGEKAFSWFDDWLEMGKLFDITGATGTRYLGVRRGARVSEAVSQGQWKVRGQRSRHFQALHAKIQATPVMQADLGENVYMWCHAMDTYKEQFSARDTWDQIRSRKAQVAWCSSVWFPQGVPRYSFILWLAVQNMLSTGDRMRMWGIRQDCVLCGERDETRDRMFFACPYSYSVWDRVASVLIGPGINPDWQDTLTFIQDGGRCQLDSILLRLAFKTTVYHVWRERNARRHLSGNQTVAQLIKLIDKAVKNRISSL